MSEWLELMLEEVDRKTREDDEARDEAERRRSGETGDKDEPENEPKSGDQSR